MAGLRYTAIGAAFELLWASQLPWLVRRLSKAQGVIFTLHRVLPDDPADFSPNAILQVKPDYLDFVIRRVRKLGLDIIDLDEAIRRIESNEPSGKFVVFTFDDAYRDNLRFALPVLRHNQCPFTLYVPTALVDGVGEVWWQALEDIVAGQNALAVTDANGETTYLPSATQDEKNAAYDLLYRRMRAMPEHERVALIRELAKQYGFDLERQCRTLIMDWPELRIFASEQLCTIGAHTVHHYELAKLPVAEARVEIDQSVKIIKAQFGKAPVHLSYPIGAASSAGPREFGLARDLGLRSAVTTRPGGLYAHHRNSLQALPRVSLNGRFQAKRYVDVFATPALFSIAKV
ncbi:MAG: polysaccharide deacetylase family protein [Devosia sp.]|jgi:peptidoglycan/xylan/chitin deacetylase (PgdA/CDA1 family)|nr:polysaccharide deacetylase family protein [Devosia sp.]